LEIRESNFSEERRDHKAGGLMVDTCQKLQLKQLARMPKWLRAVDSQLKTYNHKNQGGLRLWDLEFKTILQRLTPIET
jgi:hypothetical protein